MICKTLPVFGTAKLPGVRFDYNSVDYDEDCGVWVATFDDCDFEVEPMGEREARWWTVAIYDTWTQYGGPEEGGWAYTAGRLVLPERVRIFDSMKRAHAYVGGLKSWLERKGDPAWMIRCTTEEMPVWAFPKRTPRYR